MNAAPFSGYALDAGQGAFSPAPTPTDDGKNSYHYKVYPATRIDPVTNKVQEGYQVHRCVVTGLPGRETLDCATEVENAFFSGRNDAVTHCYALATLEDAFCDE